MTRAASSYSAVEELAAPRLAMPAERIRATRSATASGVPTSSTGTTGSSSTA